LAIKGWEQRRGATLRSGPVMALFGGIFFIGEIAASILASN
jgi:hypothetical protein